jgi:alpha-mannosidase
MDFPRHARTLTLPADDSIRIMAISVAKEEPKVSPAQPLYDTLSRTAERNAMKMSRCTE